MRIFHVVLNISEVSVVSNEIILNVVPNSSIVGAISDDTIFNIKNQCSQCSQWSQYEIIFHVAWKISIVTLIHLI